MLRHGSLFSGIGGFELAAEWAGWQNVFHCEYNTFGQRVLKHYWPDSDAHDDITKTNFTQYANRIDILTGGFPCQPYSGAGKRKGKEDERHLWPEMLRTIREVAPRYVVGENVFGLTNWNGGVVFDEVHTDLEFEGYEVAAVVIPAAAVNAPHGRDRVWFVARRVAPDAQSIRRNGAGNRYQQDIDKNQNGIFECRSKRNEVGAELERHGEGWNATNANGDKFNQRDGGNEIEPSQDGFDALYDVDAINKRANKFNNFHNFPTQPPICSGNDGVPDQLDGITFSKWRNESLKAYGNAIVPQVAFEIFNAINEYEKLQT